MNRFFSKPNLLLAVFIVSIAAFSVYGQPVPSQKQLEGKAAFDEAIKLRQEGTFKSYKLALEKFQLSAKIYEELGDRGNVGSAMLGIGLIKNLLGENDAALQNYLEALEIFRAIEHKSLEARTLNNLGNLYSELGEPQKALEFHAQALLLRKIIADKDGEARTLNALGAVYADIGERQKALEHYEKSLALRKELNLEREQAITLNNIGRVYDDLGEKQKALEYLNQSLILRRAVADKGGEAITLNNIAMAINDSEPAKALEYFQKSIEIFSSIGLENQKAGVFNGIGNSYLQLKEPQKALEYFRRAAPLYQTIGSKSGEATTLNNIGFALLALDETAPAREHFNQALVLARASQEKGLEAIILSNLMHAFQKLNNPPIAIFFGKQCVNNYQELRLAIKNLDKAIQKTYLKTIENQYRFLADLLIEDGRFAQADEVLQMLKEEEFFEFVRRDPVELKALAQRVALTPKERLILERYSKLAGTTTTIGQKFQKLDDKKRLLSRSGGTLAPDEEKEHSRLVAELADANAAFKLFLEKQLVREIGGANARKIQIDRQLQDKLRKFGNGTIALSTVVTNDRYRVVVTTPTVQIDAKTNIKAAELNKKIFAFRDALRDRKIDPRPLGKELYDILVKPIEKILKDAGAKTLVWSLDGVLRYIPFAALSPDGETYLVEKYQNVILTPKTRDDIYDSNVNWKALGMGISTEQSVTYPDFPDEKITAPALPAVEGELKAIVRESDDSNEKGVLTGRRFLNQDFTVKNLTDGLAKETADGKKEYTVVHLATHFRLAANWSNSFLFLGNGEILTLEEMSNSPLFDFSNTELVTLSACNTAWGEKSNGSEVESLAGIIQNKSGKAVLATLWSVGDESTATLMTNFYRLRKENPQKTKADAIQAAQKLFIYGASNQAANRSAKPTGTKFEYDSSRPFAHPYYWSPFVLIGNWR